MFLDKTASLTPLAFEVVVNKATEHPHTSSYNQLPQKGTYLCRRCGLALFRVSAQFHSGCGWPSFDEDLHGAVYTSLDRDGYRYEITCNRCQAHLGHVFDGEGYTPKSRRFCVNGLAIDYVYDNQVKDSAELILGGGCFWGVEHFMTQLQGVLWVESGYCGGSLAYPSYDAVCQGNTGHIEVVRVLYDDNVVSTEAILKQFFNIHDPTQFQSQGPDKGFQYQSAIFYHDASQQHCASQLISKLVSLGLGVKTQVKPAEIFWVAEDYHQNYYQKHAKLPYCHRYEDKFNMP